MKIHAKRWFMVLALLAVVLPAAVAQNLFVSDGASGNIYEYSPDGARTTFASGLSEPQGLAFDAAGNLLVAELGGGNVYKFSPAGARSTVASNVDSPNGLAFDAADNLYVAASGGGEIIEFSANGSNSIFASNLNGVTGLTFDKKGNLFAAEVDSQVIDEFETNGTEITSGAIPLQGSEIVAQYPAGIVLDGAGNLLIAASYSSYGGIYRLANALTAGEIPGVFAAPNSGLIAPWGLAFDGAGNLYVADSGNGNTNAGAVFKYAPDGAVTTFANGISPSYIAFGPPTSSGPNTWYVWQNSPANGPGTSWTNAFHDIQSAVNATANGDTVLVTNGIYNAGGQPAPGYLLTNRVCITNSIILTSVSGPAATIITGGGGIPPTTFSDADITNVRCVYLGNSNAVLSGFTLSNGNSGYTSTTPEWFAGGVWCTGGTVTNCVLVNNTSEEGGAAAEGGILLDCVISNNFTTGGEGAVGSAVLYGCLISSNLSYGYAGGAANCALSNCSIVKNNNGSDSAGGVYNCTLTNCVVADNTTPVYESYSDNAPGGAAYSKLDNCLVTGNHGYDGGGAFDCVLVNSTVVSNSAWSGVGGGVAGDVFGYSSSVVINCVVFGNIAATNANFDTNCFLSYSCSTPLALGTGNITADPQFVNSAAGNFHLLPTSPCIAAGNAAAVATATDLDGNPRFVNSAVDMGAYEFQGTPARVTNLVVSPGDANLGVGTNLQFTATEYFNNGATDILSNGITASFWSSSNPNVASMATSGIATGAAGGVTTITASYGGVSNSTLLTVVAAPVITLQPANNSVSPNDSVTLTVSATGSGLTYQWQLDGTNIVGATGATYAIAQVTATNVGVYTVMVSNQIGSVTSQAAIVGTTAVQMFAGIIVNGPVGTNYVIQSEPSLNSGWTTRTNLPLPAQPYIYIDYNSPTNPQQFYRAIPQ